MADHIFMNAFNGRLDIPRLEIAFIKVSFTHYTHECMHVACVVFDRWWCQLRFAVILKMSTGVWNSFRQRRPSADQDTLGKSQQPKTDKIASNSKSSPTNLSLDVEAAQSVLQQFDLASKYGPCRGMTRMERCVTCL